MNPTLRGLPTPRRFVSSIISALQKPKALSANPLTDTAGCKELLLTLHVLFQNELLPALDLLDRGLVTRLRLLWPGEEGNRGSSEGEKATDAETIHQHDAPSERNTTASDTAQAQDATTEPAAQSPPSTYYVRSAQQQQQQSSRHNTTSRFRHAAYEHTTYYEVRPHAWSCSCPAFTFSAFPATLPDDHNHKYREPHDISDHGGKESPPWSFGGLSHGTDLPICKHLLACTLVEHSSMFAAMVDERAVSLEKLAGWAAGWGD
ncbi:hypothetical protein B0A55_06255 [Friedmanniomyces simplex]|uniref:SWIM-type domain-containing protein n=1 Tax=Friedmanniomyces simplex TaxID=329884 RepID=A0A4V5NG05_9PEZI|nr:hypothetical protein B0A55_06255 [Friedmanniomyces simplex]